MEVHRGEGDTLEIVGLNGFLCELLRRLPASADPADSARAEARLYPDPMKEMPAPFQEDWSTYVRPELEQIFQTAVETVRQDLEPISGRPTQPEQALRFPLAHVDPWIHTLNQARLILAARFGLDQEGDTSAQGPREDLAMARLQMQVYHFLQERLQEKAGF